MEGSGCDLISGTIPEFAGMTDENHETVAHDSRSVGRNVPNTESD